MDFEFIYQPVRLNEKLNDIRKRYPSHEEFTRLDHSREIKRLLEKIASFKEDMLEQYAGKLKNSEIEIALMALPNCCDTRLCSMIASILELRFKKKLFELNWSMLQTEYNNNRLLESMSILAECLKVKNPGDYANTIFSELADWECSLPEKVHALLVSGSMDIRQFFRKYAISEDREFGWRVSELFFLGCDGEGFIRNRKVFTGLLSHLDANCHCGEACDCGNLARVAAVFSCYLVKLKTIENFDDVNYFILERFGRLDGRGFLMSLPKDCKDKFFRWLDLKSIEIHFGIGSKKFKFWADYFESMKLISRDEAEGLLFMDFGNFVVVDCKEDADASYLYSRGYFESEFERYELAKAAAGMEAAAGTGTAAGAVEARAEAAGAEVEADLDARAESEAEAEVAAGMEADMKNGAWRIIAEHVVDARDFIIEDVNSEVYRVGYERVQLLYLKEILKVKLESPK